MSCDGDAMREREGGERERLQRGERLRPHEHRALVPAVDPDAGEGREQEGRNLAREADDAEQPRGAGEAIDEPTGGDARHPGADERDALAAEEEAEVGRAERPPRVRDAAGVVAGCGWVRWRRATCPAARPRAAVLPVQAARAAQCPLRWYLVGSFAIS